MMTFWKPTILSERGQGHWSSPLSLVYRKASNAREYSEVVIRGWWALPKRKRGLYRYLGSNIAHEHPTIQFVEALSDCMAIPSEDHKVPLRWLNGLARDFKALLIFENWDSVNDHRLADLLTGDGKCGVTAQPNMNCLVPARRGASKILGSNSA